MAPSSKPKGPKSTGPFRIQPNPMRPKGDTVPGVCGKLFSWVPGRLSGTDSQYPREIKCCAVGRTCHSTERARGRLEDGLATRPGPFESGTWRQPRSWLLASYQTYQGTDSSTGDGAQQSCAPHSTPSFAFGGVRVGKQPGSGEETGESQWTGGAILTGARCSVGCSWGWPANPCRGSPQ